MGGMLRLEGSAPTPGGSNLLGILYAEDFDELPVSVSSNRGDGQATEPPERVITQADLDQACAEAVQAARDEWELSQEQLRAATFQSLQNALADARQAAEQSALAVAEGVAMTALAMLSGLLPHFSNEHGPDEVRALVVRLLPTLRSEPRITIRVHPDLVRPMQRDVAELESEVSGVIQVVPAPLERGDVKVSWEAGSLSRDTRKILQAMQDSLGQLGLQPPLETAPKRRMAHAE